MLDLLGLTHAANRRYKLLSGGEKQRLSLALALVGRPELLVLDEPTAGMDPAAKATVRSLIADLLSAGRTILLTTHELADVERLADRVVVMDRGRVVAAGTPAELVAGSGPVLRFRLTGSDGAGLAIDSSELGALGAALGGTLAPDGAPGRHRLAGRAPDPRAIAHLADWCEQRGLLRGGCPRDGRLQRARVAPGRDAPGGGHDGATNALFLLALLLGGLLVPAHQLPGVLGALASLVPSAALADSLRIGLGTSTGDALGPLLLLGAWAAGATVLTARTFRWE